jgi:lysophospholipase L1-like esterase
MLRVVGLACLAAVAAACAGAPPGVTITCIGDSLTLGSLRGGGGEPRDTDAHGGWPGRLQRRLGGRARVLNRGVGGSVTLYWLASPTDTAGRALWGIFHNLRADFPAEPPAGARTIVEGVLEVDGATIAIVLLGVNDLASSAPDDVGVVATTAGRLAQVLAAARTRARSVLVATIPPNRRDPPRLLEALNARIREAEPTYLPLAERFTAAGATALLSDEIHPNATGYQVLADAVGDELEARGLTARPAASSATREPGT